MDFVLCTVLLLSVDHVKGSQVEIKADSEAVKWLSADSEVIEQYSSESYASDLQIDFIYFDLDAVPELLVNRPGWWIDKYLPKQGIMQMTGSELKSTEWYGLSTENNKFYYTNENDKKEISQKEYDSYIMQGDFVFHGGGKKLYEYFFVFEE